MAKASRINVLEYGATGDGTTDDWGAIQRALDDVMEGGTVHIPAGRYAISRALEVHGTCRIIGDGAFPVWGSLAVDWNSINLPVQEPWVVGSVLLQKTPGEHGLLLHATGQVQQLEGIAIVFEGEHRFRDTGHGILAQPSPHKGAFDNGLSGVNWSNVVVFGHDGDHYAVKIINGIYNEMRMIHGFGGGLLHLVNDSTVDGHYGNSVFSSIYAQVFIAGQADGVRLESVRAPLNMLAFIRPQVTVNDMSETFKDWPHATSQQVMLRSVGDVRHVSFFQHDFETGVASKPVPPTTSCWLDPAGIVYVADHERDAKNRPVVPFDTPPDS